MISVSDIYNDINTLALFSLQVSYDNCGLIVDAVEEVQNVLFCLDVTNKVIDEAIKLDAKLIISHHPVIFGGIKSLCKTNPVYRLCEHGISCIAAHTNLDVADGGVSDNIADFLKILNPENLWIEECPLGRIGKLEAPLDTPVLAANAAEIFNTKPRYYDCGRTVETLAVFGGSGSHVAAAKKAGADCLFVGELKYNEWLLAQELDISVIEAGHFETEFPSMKILYDKFCKLYADRDVNFYMSDVTTAPYTTL